MSTSDPAQFAKSRDVHAALNRVLEPELKRAGFRRVRSGACGYAKPDDESAGFFTVGIQITAWGSSWGGSEFTLNASNASRQPGDFLIGGRPLMALTSAECTTGLEIERTIRSRWPLPSADHEVWSWAAKPGAEGQFWADAIARGSKVRTDLWRPGFDIWLPYFNVIDVETWGEFLRPRLLPLLARYFISPPTDSHGLGGHAG